MTTVDSATRDTGVPKVVKDIDLKLEVVVIPVADADRSKQFYAAARVAARRRLRLRQRLPRHPVHAARIGRLDPVRHEDHDGRARPRPGSVPRSSPTSRPRATSSPRLGVEISEVFHPGAPARSSRRTRRSRQRARGRSRDLRLLRDLQRPRRQRMAAAGGHDSGFPAASTPTETTFASTSDLANAMRRASVAHGEHEKRMGGEYDENWPDWYAAYMVAEQAGTELPT